MKGEDGGLLKFVEKSGGNEELADQCRTNGGKQVGAEPELQHVRRCARTQSRFHEVRFLLDCHENDAGVIVGVPQLLSDLNTTQLTHRSSEDENIGAQTEILAQNSAPIPHGSNNLVVIGQHFGDEIEHLGVAVSKQQAGFGQVAFYGIRLGGFCQATDHILSRRLLTAIMLGVP